MVGYRGCGMECIVGEDFDIECGIYMEVVEYCFYRVEFRGYG